MKAATPPKTNLSLRKNLVAGLEHLRSETQEISRLYVANLQRDMVQLIDFVNAAGSTKSSHLRHMKEVLDEIKIKPEKGRRKDLRRIELAIHSLMKVAAARKLDV